MSKNKGPTKAKAKVAGTEEPEATPVAAPTEAPAEKLSALDAAARVLREAGKPLTCKELIGQMAVLGYWSSPGGATPWATLYAAIARELKLKGKEARFRKAAPGRFEATGV